MLFFKEQKRQPNKKRQRKTKVEKDDSAKGLNLTVPN